MVSVARFKKHIFFGLVILLGGGWVIWHLFFTNTLPSGITIEPVTRGAVGNVISETGSVVPVQEVDLAFERGGRITDILVAEGDRVDVGNVLVKLDASQQTADLSAAYARLNAEELHLNELIKGADSISFSVAESGVRTAEIALENAKKNLSAVVAQQDLSVANAKKTLHSTALQAYLVDDGREGSPYSYTEPTISGTYDGEEGVYTMILYNSAAQSGSSFKVSGLETDTETVSTVNPVPLGTHGLYVQFPENYARNTVWEVPIPNTRGSSYIGNLNAYNAAVAARTTAIASAESAVHAAEAGLAQVKLQLGQISSSARDERVGAQKALVEQMQAGVITAEFAKRNTLITAPFAGVVNHVRAEVGEIVAPTAPAVSLISTNDFELTVNISESDIREVSVGDTAVVTFDAYNGLILNAHVTKIAPNAEVVDGVRVFEVKLQFDEKNEFIRAGLSADIEITAASHENVIAVPSRAIVEKDGNKFVRILEGKKIVYLPIHAGIRGSNGMTEVLDGLTEGQQIITFVEDDVLTQLETE